MLNREVGTKKKVLFSRWDQYSFFFIIAIFCVYFADWPKLPYFMDCYYHLSVMKGFSDAGGWVGQAFWEFAPFGRPHLYPPLFHFLELIFFKAGLPPILIARLFDFLIFPVFLTLIWLILRNLYGSKFSFFSLFLMGSTPSLHLFLVNHIPFTLAFLFGIFSFYYHRKGRFLSSLVCLVFSFYAHPLVPWLMVLSFIFQAFLCRSDRRLFKVSAYAIILALPLLFHELRYLDYFRILKTFEFYCAEISLLLLFLALFGFFLAIKRKGDYIFLLSLTLGFSLLYFTNRDRFFSGHMVVLFSALGSVALTEIWGRLNETGNARRLGLFLGALILVCTFLTPVILVSPDRKGARFVFRSWVIDQFTAKVLQGQARGETIYNQRLISETVDFLKQHSSNDDIFFSNYNYAAGMIALLSDRKTSTAMLREVGPFKVFDPIAYSRFVIWFKYSNPREQAILANLSQRYHLQKLGETQLAYFYLNKSVLSAPASRKTVVPLGICFAILLLCVAVIIFEKPSKITNLS